MGTTFRKYQPEQSFLLPPSPRDWLPEDHLSYFISETVDELDLSGFYAPAGGGESARWMRTRCRPSTSNACTTR